MFNAYEIQKQINKNVERRQNTRRGQRKLNELEEARVNDIYDSCDLMDTGEKFAKESQRKNREYCLKVLKESEDSKYFEYISEQLKEEVDFVKKAIEINPYVYTRISKELRKNQTIIDTVMKHYFYESYLDCDFELEIFPLIPKECISAKINKKQLKNITEETEKKSAEAEKAPTTEETNKNKQINIQATEIIAQGVRLKELEQEEKKLLEQLEQIQQERASIVRKIKK